MAAIWECFTEGRMPCPTLAAFCQYLPGLSPGWGGGAEGKRGGEREGGASFLEASWSLPCRLRCPWEGVWWATSNFCPVGFELGCSWATTWEWQPGFEFLGCGPKANTVLFDTGSAASFILRLRCFRGSGEASCCGNHLSPVPVQKRIRLLNGPQWRRS